MNKTKLTITIGPKTLKVLDECARSFMPLGSTRIDCVRDLLKRGIAIRAINDHGSGVMDIISDTLWTSTND